MPRGIYDHSVRVHPRLCGVYAILNIISGEMYIGSSEHIAKRIQSHLAWIRNGTHKNKMIRASVVEYGAEVFVALVAEVCSEEDRLQRETFWLQTERPDFNSWFDATSTKGYIPPGLIGSKRNVGSKRSVETKARMALAQQRRFAKV